MQNFEKELKQLLFELQEKRYQAQPVARVEIDKDDGGKRLLGIPTVETEWFNNVYRLSWYPYLTHTLIHQVMAIEWCEAVTKRLAQRRYFA